MARKPSSSLPSKKARRPNGPSKSNAAVTGYAKRQARKAAKKSRDDEENIYEYAPEERKASRRSKISLDLDRDEEANYEPGEDEEEDIRMKARLLGEGDRVDTDDDEEIDSDAAFEDEDEDRFAGFFGKGSKAPKKVKKKSKVRFAEVDLNEDDDEDMKRDDSELSGDEEEDEESGEDDEFIDVLDILDGRGEPLNEDEDTVDAPKPGPSKQKPHEENDEEDGDEEEDEDEEDENISISLSDAEEDAAGALDDLQNFVSSLDPSSSSKKRRADNEDGESQSQPSTQPKKRRLLREQTEAGEENEFRTKAAGLSLTDLLAPLSGNTTTAFDKSVKALQPSTSTSKKNPQTLSAPLPQRAQERLDRQAAYEQTKTEVDKWSATMKRIQEAEHLSFPLQRKETQGRTSNLELAAKFTPRTPLESTISKLLASANLATDSSVLQTEENMLKANELSVEEVNERRKELRRMRELMFRAEVKAKRVKKIKSKVYRRLKRKEKEKGDVEMDDEDDEEARMKHETERARERATLRHKNTGKWARTMMRRGGYDEDGEEGEDGVVRSGRQEMEDMLARGEKLRRKIAGKGSDDEEDGDDESGSGSDDDEAAMFNELKALRDQEALQQEEDGTKKKGGTIFDMKFMKDAEARKQQEANGMVDDFMREMGQQVGDDEDGIPEAESADGGVLVSRTGGRMIFRPGSNASTLVRTVEKAPSEGSSTLKSAADASAPSSPTTTTIPVKSTSRPLLSSQPSEEAPSSSNPWLATGPEARGAKAPRKNNEVVVDKGSSMSSKSKNKLKKQAKKTEADKTKDDAVVEIQTDVNLRRSEDDDSDGNSEVEAQEAALASKKKGKGKGKGKGQVAFEQRDLVARAFAGDNVVKDFEDAKQREIMMDAPKEVDTTLPGWGSWGGTGTTKRPPKASLIKKVAGVDPKSRADYKKSHVIISEKRDKKAAKYQVNDLPYPYTSKAQYERRMEQPLGPEWNTRVGFQKGTLPKVVKKMGTVIDPLEKLF
ncbi:hypothetical protein V5O48_001286 [Marasmius crinis-equi]|uniref:Utp14-domain-containing protein n=1 Tax=Marasmius crinis-equi TaxID=585013 RepID=A0ABR3FZB1_9AGAR